MRRRLPEVAPMVDVDLDYRPASYWADGTPADAIVQNIAGTRRREMVRDFIASDDEEELGEIDDTLLEDRLSDNARQALGSIHPSFMGGEYLPERASGEIEIARVELASTTNDVISLTARRRGNRWLYRMVDEYESIYHLKLASSSTPLSLAQLIGILESAEGGLGDTGGLGMVRCWVHRCMEEGEDVASATGFVSVSSEVYPELSKYYWKYLDDWAATEWPDASSSSDDDDDDDTSEDAGEDADEAAGM